MRNEPQKCALATLNNLMRSELYKNQRARSQISPLYPPTPLPQSPNYGTHSSSYFRPLLDTRLATKHLAMFYVSFLLRSIVSSVHMGTTRPTILGTCRTPRQFLRGGVPWIHTIHEGLTSKVHSYCNLHMLVSRMYRLHIRFNLQVPGIGRHIVEVRRTFGISLGGP
jgi:hypothetical protein